ncbi:MAG TPA: carboxymuconolactone decarboxylase family protein [Smithella sp.]|nr:carboxymuconolactone decarboxylase family protein [Smithella sp.]MDM7985842.1 carboxymuconolactone decarboxylase family protein [Smithella sp.]HNY50061.1 carboxymuconolactone decarboxylase family protein [Smithella sp.]HOG90249.1 carboxymuconolactone decarboxylase family protein [Smithella sp.]HQG66559.1 carboxymuconolactone decarboxylase family protein [Smithella sp.]
MVVRIPCPEMESMTPEVRSLVESFPLNVARMVANAPASIKGFLELAQSILFNSEFDPRKREIAILRVAHVTKAIYEWTHHVNVAKHYNVTDQEIEIICTEMPVKSLDEDGNLLCRVADEISRDVRLSDDALAQILERYGTRQATELILCVSFFNFVSRFLESTRVELEDSHLQI